MKKHILILLILFGIFNNAVAQETILMPTQEEWDNYVEQRVKELQVKIYNLAIEGKIKAFKSTRMNSKACFTPEEVIRITNGVEVIVVEVTDTTFGLISTPDEPIYKSVEIPKEFSADSFDGLCFYEQQDSNLSSSSVSAELDGIGLLMRPWLPGNMRDDNFYPVFWSKKEALYKLLYPQDISFLNNLYRIANYSHSHILAQKAMPEWREYINSELFRKNGKPFFIDSSFLKLPKAILKSSLTSTHGISGPIYDVQYKKSFPAEHFLVGRYEEYELIEIIDNEKSTTENPVLKTVKIPMEMRLPPPHSLTFEKNNSLSKIILHLDKAGITTKDKNLTNKPFYQFEIPRETILSNYNLRNLSWWFEDYYRWMKRAKK